ncbi:hypothetical protein [Streptomyces sp. NPDC050392]|uniref:hypothetical protein n=1 Tax=Streptomyces sp. NPDC050392 TaxID=3155782 RepID=UPI003421A99D
MTRMHNDGSRNRNVPASPYMERTIEELLAEIEHEAMRRRCEARVLRRRLRRQQPLRVRAGKVAGTTLALIGIIAFVGAGVVFVLGDAMAAGHLVTLAAATWGGAAAMAIFTRM